MQFTIRGLMITSLALGLFLGMVAQVRSMPDGEWRAYGVVIVAVLMVLIVLSVGLVVSFLRHITRRPPR